MPTRGVRGPDGALYEIPYEGEWGAQQMERARRLIAAGRAKRSTTAPGPQPTRAVQAGAAPRFPEPPEGPTALRAPTGFERYFRDPLTQGASKVVGETAAQFLVPQTPAELGATAALTAVSPVLGRAAPLAARGLLGSVLQSPFARRAIRIGAAAVGGAVGGKLGGESPVTGAAEGLTGGLVGESAQKVTSWLGTKLMRRLTQSMDREEVGRVLQGILPELPPLETPEQFADVFLGEVGRRRLSDAFDQRLQKRILPAVQGKMARLESLNLYHERPRNLPLPFEEAIREFLQLGQEAYRKGDPLEAKAARRARAVRAETAKDLVAQLETVQKGLGTQFQEILHRYGFGQEMIRMFRSRQGPHLRAFTPKGDINFPFLSEQASLGRRESLQKVLEPEDYLDLRRAFGRGVESIAQEIEGGLRPSFGIHPGIPPSPRIYLHGGLGQHIGRRFEPAPIPFDLAAIFGLGGTLGTAGVAPELYREAAQAPSLGTTPTRAFEEDDPPPLPAETSPGRARALMRRAMEDLYPGRPAASLRTDPAVATAIDRRMRELYWASQPAQRR